MCTIDARTQNDKMVCVHEIGVEQMFLVEMRMHIFSDQLS